MVETLTCQQARQTPTKHKSSETLWNTYPAKCTSCKNPSFYDKWNRNLIFHTAVPHSPGVFNPWQTVCNSICQRVSHLITIGQSNLVEIAERVHCGHQPPQTNVFLEEDTKWNRFVKFTHHDQHFGIPWTRRSAANPKNSCLWFRIKVQKNEMESSDIKKIRLPEEQLTTHSANGKLVWTSFFSGFTLAKFYMGWVLTFVPGITTWKNEMQLETLSTNWA